MAGTSAGNLKREAETAEVCCAGDHIAERRKTAVLQGKQQNAQTTSRVAAVAGRAAAVRTRADRGKRGPHSDDGDTDAEALDDIWESFVLQVVS